MKLQHKTLTEQAYNDELESLRDTLNRERLEFELQISTANHSELTALKAKVIL